MPRHREDVAYHAILRRMKREAAAYAQERAQAAPGRVTHIAGYVPPKGSIAMWFCGRVVSPLKGLGL